VAVWDHLPVEALGALVDLMACGSWKRTLDQIRSQPEKR
jgi:hypothetical protein